MSLKYTLLIVFLTFISYTLSTSTAPSRRALFWLVPYNNVSSIDGYQSIWQQFKQYYNPNIIVAGSSYALKHNGTLGYADTAAGEGLYGITMVQFGFPALLSMNLTTLAMVYFTHTDGISIVLKNPQPFINSLVQAVQSNKLHGVDLDYEPQGVYDAIQQMKQEDPTLQGDPFYTFLNLLGTEMQKYNYLLTVDATGGCSQVDCNSYAATTGLTQVNTMDTFNIGSLSDFVNAVQSDLPGLHNRWAPGFEPGNFNDANLHKAILSYAASHNVTAIATWAIHEYNVGNQPDYLFENVLMYLTSP